MRPLPDPRASILRAEEASLRRWRFIGVVLLLPSLVVSSFAAWLSLMTGFGGGPSFEFWPIYASLAVAVGSVVGALLMISGVARQGAGGVVGLGILFAAILGFMGLSL